MSILYPAVELFVNHVPVSRLSIDAAAAAAAFGIFLQNWNCGPQKQLGRVPCNKEILSAMTLARRPAHSEKNRKKSNRVPTREKIAAFRA